MELYILANGLNVAPIGGVHFVDHDRIRAPQVDLAGEVAQFMPRTVRVYNYDFQIGGIEGSVVIAAVPQNYVGLEFRLVEDGLVVDGANEVQTFFRVVFPVMAPINVVIVVITAIEALRAFDIAFIINQGKNGLELLSILITNNSVSEASLVGFGSAIAVVLLVISLGPIIGFLSHVQGDLKQKAHEVGCDMVLPRSAFSQNLPQLLRRHGAPDDETAG